MSLRYHIVLSRPFDLAAHDREAAEGAKPRHTMSALARNLDATVHRPGDVEATAGDRWNARTLGIGDAPLWALARHLSQQLGPDDVIFTIGEDAGFPLATYLARRPDRPRLTVFVHTVRTPRARYMFWRYGLTRVIDRVVTNTEFKAEVLRSEYGFGADRVFNIAEQTDTQFFTPGPSSPEKARALIGSGGLEQRDYVTLAEATAAMDADVRICAMSPNATARKDTFPRTLPANMAVGQYDWPDLRQLYRDADVVVISLKDHNYQAGLTTLFEALACKRPVVMTETPGLVQEFARAGYLTAVPPYAPDAMRTAIEGLLADPDGARAQAERGYAAVHQHHTSERYVADLAAQIRLAAGDEPVHEILEAS